MKNNKFKKFWKNPGVLLCIIFLVAAILRIYNAAEFFEFAHDGDLYSWIFKDIVVDRHLRLIGQLTSTSGIFIGPFFYYSIIPFFYLTNLEPIGTIYYALILGILTAFSFYFVFKKLFNFQTGIIAFCVHGFFLQRVIYDRFVVPTITTSIWEIWYFYTLGMICRGNFAIFPLLGLLVGSIWHISFSLAPALIAVPAALILAKKLPTLKELLLAILGFIIPSVPLFLFEFKHNFSQTRSFIDSFKIDQHGGSGIDKLIFVFYQVSGNVYNLLFYPERGQLVTAFFEDFFGKENIPILYSVVAINSVTLSLFLLLFVILLMLGVFLVRKKVLELKLLVVLYTLILGVISFFAISSKPISEYYFTSINMVILSILILFFSYLFRFNWAKKVVILFFVFIAFRSFYFLAFQYQYNYLGYKERLKVVNFIKSDAAINNYPCVAVSYIAEPGKDLGFRYIFYKSGLHVNHPDSGSPIYSIVVPWNIADGPNKVTFGGFGVIPEGSRKTYEEIKYSCSGDDSNLTDPMLQFVKL